VGWGRIAGRKRFEVHFGDVEDERASAFRAMCDSEVVIFSGFGGEVAVDRRGCGSGRGTLRELLALSGGVAFLIDVGDLPARDARDLGETRIWRKALWRRSWAEVCEIEDGGMVGMPVSEGRVQHERARVSVKGVVRAFDAEREHFVVEFEDGQSVLRTRAELLETVLLEGEPAAMQQLNRVLGSRSLHPADKVAW